MLEIGEREGVRKRESEKERVRKSEREREIGVTSDGVNRQSKEL
jgi:hypothetical protein